MKKKEEVLLEMKEFRKVFNKIGPAEFYFNEYVNHTVYCRTVCCLWGWIPTIAPEIAARYNLVYANFTTYGVSQTPSILNWPKPLRLYLFNPEVTLLYFKRLKGEASLLEVLEAWDKVIDTLENTERLDYLFLNQMAPSY